MVTFENKSTSLNKISEALEDNLNIIPSNSSLSTIVNKISDSRYSFKLIDETETLPISSERPSLLYKNWLYVAGAHDKGCGLVIIDTDTMKGEEGMYVFHTVPMKTPGSNAGMQSIMTQVSRQKL